MFPESARFNYSKQRYDEARKNLETVAKFNGIKNYNSQNFMFDTEKEQLDLANMEEIYAGSTKSVKCKDGGNLYGITNKRFY